MSKEELLKLRRKKYNHKYYQKNKSPKNEQTTTESKPDKLHLVPNVESKVPETLKSSEEKTLKTLKRSQPKTLKNSESEITKTSSEAGYEEKTLKNEIESLRGEIKTLISAANSESLKRSQPKTLKNSESEFLKSEIISLKHEIGSLKMSESKTLKNSECESLNSNNTSGGFDFWNSVKIGSLAIFILCCISWTVHLSAKFHESENIPFPFMVSLIIEIGLIISTVYARKYRHFIALSAFIFVYLCWSMVFPIVSELETSLGKNQAAVLTVEHLKSSLESHKADLTDKKSYLSTLKGHINDKKEDITSMEETQKKLSPTSYEYKLARNDIKQDKSRLDTLLKFELDQQKVISDLEKEMKAVSINLKSKIKDLNMVQSDSMNIVHHVGFIFLRIIMIFLSVVLTHTMIFRYILMT